MTGQGIAQWNRYCEYLYIASELGFSLDISRVRFDDNYIEMMDDAVARALDAMKAIEAGAIANRDEGRMVGHYWLRSPDLAPTEAIRDEIRAAQLAVHVFADRVLEGKVSGAYGSFLDLVHVGIGDSAVGAQLLHEASWRGQSDGVVVHFLDNSDPDGIDRVLSRLRGGLGRTLISVVSKSGITPTPWHVMLELEGIYQRAGLNFARHAVATTITGSQLDVRAADHEWLVRFPIWDWVGGRTSVMSAVGLLPAAMLGIDIDSFIDGAATMDHLTRASTARNNPAVLLALMWYWVGNGRGEKDMVVLPYSDRLAGVPRWIQQLVMESVGKQLDRAGRTVYQGLTVYGNKGSTDQHAYMQQLRDGKLDFFITFIRVHREREGFPVELEPDVTLGDHLFGGLEGTRAALYDRGRDSITITLMDTEARSLGALIALYERAVGLYAELINVNGYHQPGVDKYAAEPILTLQCEVLAQLRIAKIPQTAEQLADAIGKPDQVETVYKLLEHLALSGGRAVLTDGKAPHDTRFSSSLQISNAKWSDGWSVGNEQSADG
jgi:glucose-6-phosphate isomerase